MSWEIKQVAKPKLKKPILIEGLPGMGNVGKIAADFIVDNLKAKKIFEFHSYKLPQCVFVNEKNLVELPTIEMYYVNLKDKSLLLLIGDIQPLDEESCYEFCNKTLDLFKKVKGKEVITLGGIGLQKIPSSPRIYCTGNSKKIIQKYKTKNVNNNLYGFVGPIIGVSGLLIGIASQKNIPAVSLLAETFGHPNYLGIKGAREILKVLNKQLNLNLNMKQLNKEVEDIEKEIKHKLSGLEKIPQIRKKSKVDINYIG